MSIIRKVQRTTYTVVDNGAIRDERLSWRATGLLAYLLSLPDGWTVNTTDLARRKTDGRHAVRMALIELAESGYVERRTENDPETGHLRNVTMVYEEPVGNTLELGDIPTSDRPTSVVRTQGITKVVSTEEASNQEPKGAPNNGASLKPTPDQTYLASRIVDEWGSTSGTLGPAALQKLNNRFGVEIVTGALRSLHGFPPEEAVKSPYAYVVAICEQWEAS